MSLGKQRDASRRARLRSKVNQNKNNNNKKKKRKEKETTHNSILKENEVLGYILAAQLPISLYHKTTTAANNNGKETAR